MRIPLFYKFKKQKKSALIVHICYHKCMTVFFIRVYSGMAKKWGWRFHANFVNETDKFLAAANKEDKNKIIMASNPRCEVSELPEHFIGSHIVRDPRDLLVSGYNYHKWCKEQWAHVPLTEKKIKHLRLDDFGLQKDLSSFSYQDLLNNVDIQTGMMIELNWRTYSFRHMLNWDYNDSRFMELRYEDIFGNEMKVFSELFKHYGLDEKMTSKGLKYVEMFTFEKQKKMGNTGGKQHISKGVSGQWKEYFSDELKAIFKEKHQDLLIKLGYEYDDTW